MLDAVIAALELKPDRIAVELNGEIVRRAAWPETSIRSNDRLEIVHFVGGGST
jgi:sulfur carrier protein